MQSDVLADPFSIGLLCFTLSSKKKALAALFTWNSLFKDVYTANNLEKTEVFSL